MKKITPIIAAALTTLLPLIPSQTKAQDFFIQGDLVSSYIWRGMKSGGISLQPSFGFAYKGLSIYTWASTSFRKEKNEIDIYLDYEYKNLKLSFADFFTQGPDNELDYFDYRKGHTRHVYDAGVEYTLCSRFPLKLSWYTFVAGDDFFVNGKTEDSASDKRCYSTYIEAMYPFAVKDVQCSIAVGMTPWKGTYADKAAVNNVTLAVNKNIRINDKLNMPVFGKLIGNPFESRVYAVLGLGIRY